MKPNKLLIALPLIIAVVLAGGLYIGKKLATQNTTLLFTDSSLSQNDKLHQVMQYIQSDYVDTVREQQIVEKTINEILQNLDPHSYYIPKSNYHAMNDPLEGNFEGIGIEFRIQDDTVIVVQPIGGGPSEKLGIMAGDRIIKVEEEDITGNRISNQKVVKLLKGPKGTIVNIQVKRGGNKDLIDFSIKRDEIPLYSVEANYLIDGKIGYIKVIRFARTTYDEFISAVEDLQSQGMEKLILDLRNNTGGFMKSAIDMADEFLPKGKLIVYTKGKAREKKEFFATSSGKLEDTEVAVLINEGSASASEILAGALQDNDIGHIIGRRSFGKGLVQEGIQWPDGSAMRLTVARYYTPVGRSIQKSYEEGLDQYNEETYQRYDRGELLSKDSIKLDDSLKYFTEKGKVLYGGGGIMPDYFIPIDTSSTNQYFGKLNYRGIFYQFGFNYVDQHRENLTANYDENSFYTSFKVDSKMMSDLYEFATEKGISFDEKQAKETEELSKSRLKAYIGRNVWGENIFYRVINENDDIVNKAIDLLQKEES